MKRIVLGTAVLCAASSMALAASAPTAATIITNADVQKVLKLGAKETDHTIRVIDMGQGYQMSVAVIHRGSTHDAHPPNPAAAAARAKLADCGVKAAPAGAKLGSMKNGMLVHDFTPETYIVTKGGGTLVTGGTLYNAKRQPADSHGVMVLNGPGCSGQVYGDFVVTPMKVGDIAVVPAGVPHGWSDIPVGVTYLSIRPDPKHVLPAAGFTYPGL